LKRLAWKKNQPLYVLRIDPRDFLENEDELKKINVESAKALEETAYILVNEDGLKLPF
jgi:hypothetical protein